MATAAQAISELANISALPESQRYEALKALANTVDAIDPQGGGRTALFYGGEFRNFASSGAVKASEIAQLLTQERPGEFYRIDDTEIGKFLGSADFRNALFDASGGDEALVNARLNGDPVTSFWGDASER